MNKSYQNFKKRAGKLAIALTLVGATTAGGMAIGADAATVKSGYTSTAVNLRKSASTKSARLTTIKKGQKVTILKTSGKWLKVKYNGKTGYVYKTYVKKTFTTKDYAGKFKLKVDLNVRKGPGTSFVKAGTLKKGTVVTVKGKTSNGWYTITYKGATRYISASSKYLTKYVAPTPTPTPDPTPTPGVNQAPTLNVQDKYYVTTGDTFNYSDLGAIAYDKEDGDLTSKIQYKCITSPEGVNPSNGVNPNKAGNYEVRVTVTDSKGASASETVYVIVGRNQGPKLSIDLNHKRVEPGIDGYSNLFIVEKGSVYSHDLLPITASDLEDGDLTSKIKISGVVDTSNTHNGVPYPVKVSVTDSKGATTIMNIGVVVVENEKPTIDSKNDIYILEGDTFSVDTLKAKADIKAYDKYDLTADNHYMKDLTDEIVYSYVKDVNTSKPGVYKVLLAVKDSHGLSNSKYVNVHVVENKAPVINYHNTIEIVEGTKFDYSMLYAEAFDLEQYGGANGNDTRDILTPYKNLDVTYSGGEKVDINTPGKYKVTLSATDGRKTTTKEAWVIVKGNREAVIDCRDSIKVPVGEKLTTAKLAKLINLSITDYEDGDITNKAEFIDFDKVDTNFTGAYKVTISAIDSGNVTVTKDIVIYVVESNPAIKPVE